MKTYYIYSRPIGSRQQMTLHRIVQAVAYRSALAQEPMVEMASYHKRTARGMGYEFSVAQINPSQVAK